MSTVLSFCLTSFFFSPFYSLVLYVFQLSLQIKPMVIFGRLFNLTYFRFYLVTCIFLIKVTFSCVFFNQKMSWTHTFNSLILFTEKDKLFISEAFMLLSLNSFCALMPTFYSFTCFSLQMIFYLFSFLFAHFKNVYQNDTSFYYLLYILQFDFLFVLFSIYLPVFLNYQFIIFIRIFHGDINHSLFHLI